MFCDMHVHTRGDTTGAEVLKAMDAVEMEKVILLSKHASASDAEERAAIDALADIVAVNPQRLIGFAWIEPTLEGAVERVGYAMDAKGLRGVKMIPDHWYPYEERLFPVYSAIEERKVPILFHSGILYGNGDSSRFCRPCFFEALLHFPKLKFALAHISWPWTDECIATFGRMRAAVKYKTEDCQMYIDTTRGTPAIYRTDALRKALACVSEDRIIYGSDDSIPSDFTYSRKGADEDRAIIIDELGQSQEVYDKIMRTNIEDFLTPFA